jgi:hypothetical protein
VNQVFNGTTAPLVASTATTESLASVVATVNVPSDNATIRNMRVVEPSILGPNFDAFGAISDKCPANSAISTNGVDYSFDKTNCPSQAKVGTMVITSPLLPYTINGDVYLIEHATLPWFGVSFDSQAGININIVGQTGLPAEEGCIPANQPNNVCPQTITVNFTRLPDIPFTKVVFSLNGPDRVGTGGQILSGKLLRVGNNGAPQCQSPANAASSILPNSTLNEDGAVLANQPIQISGCTYVPPDPEE